MNEELFKTTVELLKNRSASLMLQQIAADTGIKYSWICALHNGRIENKYRPKQNAENNLKVLYEYLVAKRVHV